MLIRELFEEAVYYQASKRIGAAAGWLEAFGASKEDVQTAFTKAKELQSYKDLVAVTPDTTNKTEARIGSFSFGRTSGEYFAKDAPNQKYRVQASGQVRGTDSENRNNWPITSDKPEIFPGDPVKSILMAYDSGFKKIKNTFAKSGKMFKKALNKKTLYINIKNMISEAALPVRVYNVMAQNLIVVGSDKLEKLHANKRGVGFLQKMYDGPDEQKRKEVDDSISVLVKQKTESAQKAIFDEEKYLKELADSLKNNLAEYKINIEVKSLSFSDFVKYAPYFSGFPSFNITEDVYEAYKDVKFIFLNINESNFKS